MSYPYPSCDDVNLCIQRDYQISFETISIKNYKTVSDLLEQSRSILNFQKYDQLSAHKTSNGERIDDSVYISDIAHLGTVVIKYTETRANHDDGLALVPEKQDGNSKEIRHRRDIPTADEGEIRFLNSQLAGNVEGFVFEIVPGDYTNSKKESENILTFSSEKKYKKNRPKIHVIEYWSNWQPHKALPCWGVRINNNVGKDNPSKQSYRSKNQETSKIPTTIMTKTSFHQVREFGVNVTINEKAVKEAKKILNARTKRERQTIIKNFNDKYCSFVYSGKFSAGAWLRTKATSTRLFKGPKGQISTNLKKCAAEETEHYWSWVTQVIGNRYSSYQPLRNKDPSVKVSMDNASDPPGIRKMYQLEEKIKNVRCCAVFPANWDDKSHFTPVYEIMKSQAEANKDADLQKVADIFKECMEETSHSDTVTDMEVDDCFSKVKIDVKEKETIEKMDTQETSYREETKGTENRPGLRGSSSLQNAEGQNWNKQASGNMYTNDHSERGNWYGLSGTRENQYGSSWNREDRGRKIRDASFPFSSDYKFMTTDSEDTLNKKLENTSAQMSMDDKPMPCTSLVPYVVFLGDAGTGKSTIVEKLTGEKERSSKASESFTRSSEAFIVPDGSLVVADTPGSNSRKDKVENNIWIAGALNFQPVSRIFIVSKAQPRIDSVIDNVCKYADNFVELPFDVLGVLVSHMDLVEWKEEDFMSAIDDELGIDAVIFSQFNTTAETLLPKILDTCTERHDLTVNHENFAKIFKIPNNHRKILTFTSDEVKKFSLIREAFDKRRKGFANRDQIDLALEFLTFMSDEIADAKDRMTEYNNFTFKGDSAALEAGHVLNMVNQLNTVLVAIRKECFKHQCEYGVSEFRKCPYCGLIWTKKESCSGNTICGNEDSTVSDTRDGKYAVFGTFSFAWESDKLTINKNRKQDVNSRPMFGCGKTINWKDMATVQLPTEFRDTIQLCSSGIKVDPSSESSLGRVGEMAREFTRWLSEQWNKSTRR